MLASSGFLHFPVFARQGFAFRVAKCEMHVKPTERRPSAGTGCCQGKGQARPRTAPSLPVGVMLKVSLVNPE